MRQKASSKKVLKGPGSNWAKLKKRLAGGKPKDPNRDKTIVRANRFKVKGALQSNSPDAQPASYADPVIANMMKVLSKNRPTSTAQLDGEGTTNASSLPYLQKLVRGQLRYSNDDSEVGKCVALDCEMVQVVGDNRSLARVSIVNFHGAVLLDTYVKQTQRVTDFVTRISGIRPRDLNGPNAQSLDEVIAVVHKLLPKDVQIVGHAVRNDLKLLKLSPPLGSIYDTQKAAASWKGGHPKLSNLVKDELGTVIQQGEHDSITDARAAMALFRLWGGQAGQPFPEPEKRPIADATMKDAESEESVVESVSGEVETGHLVSQSRMTKSMKARKERIKKASHVKITPKLSHRGFRKKDAKRAVTLRTEERKVKAKERAIANSLT